ncbi:MAG: class I SAM-dependent methyltransferase [Anaerolineaceae bacterium]|nr:class I SAM-dependent methyltransferase [Anaerolineaceae bacterium]
MYSLTSNRISQHWSKETDFSRTFFGFPPFRDYIRHRITGQTAEWEYWFLIKKLLIDRLPVENCLSIFCGHGENEIRLSKLGVFRNCIAIDISTEAIEKAKKKAKNDKVENIDFVCGDLNKSNLIANNYFDLVIANGALHHSMDLENLILKIKASMKFDALFLSSEYVGNNHYGKEYHQYVLIKALQDLLPISISGVEQGKIKNRIIHETKRKVSNVIRGSELLFRIINLFLKMRLIIQDPSEAANSCKIIPLLMENFKNVEIKNYGGAILPYVISPILMDVFDLSDPMHIEIINLFIKHEIIAEEIGDVKSDYAFIISRNE